MPHDLTTDRPTTVTVLVDRELRQRLELAAAENERSLGAEVRVALRRYLPSENEEEPAHE